MLVRAFVQPGDVVLEFGARYGSTSCLLSQIVGSTGVVVSVEPDTTFHEPLLANRHNHRCSFHIVLGAIVVGPQQSTATTHTMTLSEVEHAIGNRTINVAVMMDRVKYESALLERMDVVLTDATLSLDQQGFRCVWSIHDSKTRRVAWLRVGSDRLYPSCEEFATRAKPPKVLRCGDCPS